MRVIVPLLVILTLATAGCVTNAGTDASASAGASSDVEGAPPGMTIEGAFTDADARAYDHVAGYGDEQMTVNVPLGTTQLVVKAAYRAYGAGSFAVANTAMIPEKQDTFSGARELYDEEWLVLDNPVPGPWTFRAQLSGGGEYAFGFYVE